MHPLSFREWRELRKALGVSIASEQDDSGLAQECAEYLLLGGFPANVVRRGELRAVQASLRNAVIAQAVRDDLGRLRGLRDIDNLERVFVARLASSGAQLSVRDDAKLTSASEPTVRNWLQGMLDTGLLWALESHVRSSGKFERGQPKLYAVDPSLVAACSLPVFGPGDLELSGRQIETAVAQALRRFCEPIAGARCSVYQQKGRSGHKEGEVDFVVELGGQRYAIEVATHQDRKKIPGLARVARDLDASFAAVVSMRTRAETELVAGQTIHFLPLHDLLLRLAIAQEAWPW